MLSYCPLPTVEDILQTFINIKVLNLLKLQWVLKFSLPLTVEISLSVYTTFKSVLVNQLTLAFRDQVVVYDEFNEQLQGREKGWYETCLLWKENHSPLPNNKEEGLHRFTYPVWTLQKKKPSIITLL